MPDRRRFLAAVATTGAALMLAGKAGAQLPEPSPSPSGSPSPPPSERALTSARAMRAYDPKLTDEEVTVIARAIDSNIRDGKRLNPSGKRLKNSDEPIAFIRLKP